MRYETGQGAADYVIDLSSGGEAVLCDGSQEFHDRYGGRCFYTSRSGMTVAGWIPNRPEQVLADSVRWDTGEPLGIDVCHHWPVPIVLYDYQGGWGRGANGVVAILVKPRYLDLSEEVDFIVCDRLADIPAEEIPADRVHEFTVGRFRPVEYTRQLVWHEQRVKVLECRLVHDDPSIGRIVRRVVGERPMYQVPTDWLDETLPIHLALGLRSPAPDVRVIDADRRSLTDDDVWLRVSHGTVTGTVPMEDAMPPFDSETVRSFAPWATVLDPTSVLVHNRVWRLGALCDKDDRLVCVEYAVGPADLLRLFCELRRRPAGAWLDDDLLPQPLSATGHFGYEDPFQPIDFRYVPPNEGGTGAENDSYQTSAERPAAAPGA